MPGLNELADDFADGTLNTTLWSGSYGDPTESSGKAHIPCSTGYAGLKSATTYTLTSNSVFVRLHAADPTGATSAAASVLVLSSVGGSDAGFIVDTAQGAIGLWLREGYADPGALFPAYDAEDHAWLRLRETSGTLHWEASPDGLTWTTLRTAATPAWAADTNLAFLVEGHRDAGPTTSIDLDTVNVPPALDLTAAQLTLQVQPLTLRKTLPLIPLTIHHAPTTLTGTKHHTLTTAVQTLTAPTLTPSKHLALTGASQTLTAHVLASPTAEEAVFEVGQPYTNWEAGQPW